MSLSENESLFDEDEIDSEDEEPASNDEGYKSLTEIDKFHFIYIMNLFMNNYLKYGYVSGDDPNLIKRLHDGKDKQLEIPKFKRIFKIRKTKKYKNIYNEPDKLFSLVAPKISKIQYIENTYNCKLPLLSDLNQYLYKYD